MENNEFKFTYSAPSEAERREIESIRKQYVPAEESKLERLKKLDNKVQSTPKIFALIFGIIGTLIFGLGLTCALEWGMMALCVVLSIIGIVLLAFAYPVYAYILKKNKDKYADEILRLSKELLGENA